MIVGTTAKWPMEHAFDLIYRSVVDACVTKCHQSVLCKFPIFIPIGAIPVARVVMPFIGEAYRDPVFIEGPKLFDEPVIKFTLPFPAQEVDDLNSSPLKLCAITPLTI